MHNVTVKFFSKFNSKQEQILDFKVVKPKKNNKLIEKREEKKLRLEEFCSDFHIIHLQYKMEKGTHFYTFFRLNTSQILV